MRPRLLYTNELRKDVKAVSLNGEELNHASDELRDDKDVVLAALREYRLALMFASPRLQDDDDVVRASLMKYGGSIRYASKSKQADPEFATLAVKQNFHAVAFLNREMTDREDVAMHVYGGPFKHLSLRLRANKAIVYNACRKENGSAFTYASPELRDDKDVFDEKCNQEDESFNFYWRVIHSYTSPPTIRRL